MSCLSAPLRESWQVAPERHLPESLFSNPCDLFNPIILRVIMPVSNMLLFA